MATLALILFIPLLFLAWAQTFPELALALLAELRRQFRLWVIHRSGDEQAHFLFGQLRVWGTQKGIKARLIEEVINTHKAEVSEQFGRCPANRVLGEPTPLERYH